MTSRPRLERNSRQVVGLLSLVLFAVLSAVFLTAEFGGAAGFPGDGSITAAIGYAMFNLDAGAFPSEGFLVTFEIIDLVLVAALAAAVMLARREGGSLPLRTDGGEPGGRASSDRQSDGGTERTGDEDGGDR
ncbi:NADH-quinone oxidoreductase subunit J [Haloglomus salinum]|jgi:NADH-quinone oxidoreductase subunit J|uniref:NADH-quinone oxidoreductase subunit J n=1 Tax=Haloglomus salinum TaxID=2962673 RepID=UPI0020C9F50A|nr:NADH-quinone oxidoreductase subunit J [Haloglomus salinum]